MLYELAVAQHKSRDAIAATLQDPNLPTSPLALQSAIDLFREPPASDSSFTFDGDYWRSIANATLGSIAVVGAVIAPEIAIPLGLAAAWSDPLLKSLDDSGHAQTAFPPTDPRQQDLLAQVLFRKATDACGAYPQLQDSIPQTIDIPGYQLGGYYDDDAAAVAKMVPVEWQVVSSPLAVATPEQLRDPAFLAPLQSALQAQLQKQYDGLSDKIGAINQALVQAQHDGRAEQERQIQRQAIAKTDADFAGATEIASFFAKHAFVNAAAANKILVAGDAMRRVYTSVTSYLTRDIGVIALSGGILGAADALMSLFGGGAPDPVLEQLSKISNQLVEIQQQLGVVISLEGEILKAISDLMNAVQSSRQEAQRNYEALHKLAILELRNADNTSRDQDLNGCLGEANAAFHQLSDQQKDHFWSVIFNGHLDKIYTYAVSNSASSYFTATEADSPNLPVLLSETSRRADLFFGAIPSACRDAGVTYAPKHAAPSGANREVPNPIMWSRSALTYLQLSAAGARFAGGADADELKGLWLQGLRIREAVQVFASSGTIAAFSDLLVRFAGFGHAGSNSADSVRVRLSKIVGEVTTAAGIGRYRVVPPNPNGMIYGGMHPQSVENDPFQPLLEIGAIRLVQYAQLNNSPCCKVFIVGGAEDGQELVAGIRMYEGPNFGFPRARVFYNDPNDTGFFNHPAAYVDDVMGPAETLVFARRNAPIVAEQVPAKLREALSTDRDTQLYDNFLWAATALRWAAVVAKWRSAPEYVEPEIAASLGNVSVPSTPAEFQDALRAGLSRPGALGYDLAADVDMTFEKLIKDMNSLAAASASGLVAERGLGFVDDTMKALGAYMIANGIVPPPITVSAQAQRTQNGRLVAL